MKKFAIKAYEQTYGGLHGMYDCAIIEVSSYHEAEEIAAEMSIDAMNSYSCITEGWEDEARDMTNNEDDFQEYMNELEQENIEYDLYPLKDDAPSTEGEDFDSFVQKWQDKNFNVEKF